MQKALIWFIKWLDRFSIAIIHCGYDKSDVLLVDKAVILTKYYCLFCKKREGLLDMPLPVFLFQFKLRHTSNKAVHFKALQGTFSTQTQDTQHPNTGHPHTAIKHQQVKLIRDLFFRIEAAHFSTYAALLFNFESVLRELRETHMEWEQKHHLCICKTSSLISCIRQTALLLDLPAFISMSFCAL